MRQQINLYQPVFRHQRKVFSTTTMAQIVLVITLGLAAIYAFGTWQSAALERDVIALEAQRQDTQSRFDALGRTLSASRDDKGLLEQIRLAQAEVEAKRRLLQWLGERGSDRPTGFATHLAGLARQHQPGLWLSRIRIADRGRSVALEGNTRDPAGLVRYLRRLGKEPAFKGLEFLTVRLERTPAEPQHMDVQVALHSLRSPRAGASGERPTTARFLVATDVVAEKQP